MLRPVQCGGGGTQGGRGGYTGGQGGVPTTRDGYPGYWESLADSGPGYWVPWLTQALADSGFRCPGLALDVLAWL